MEHEITLNDIFGCFKRKWWKIAIFALVVTLLVGVFTYFFTPKKYSSSIEYYIINANENADYAQTALLSASIYLANDYIDIINGDEIMTAACEKLEEKGYKGFTPNKIRKLLSASTAEDSSIFAITVTDTDPKRAYEIASVLTEITPQMLTDITKIGERTASVPITTSLNAIAEKLEKDYAEESKLLYDLATELKENNHSATLTAKLDNKDAVRVIRNPVEPKTHRSPNLVRNCMIAFILGAVVSFAFFVIRSFFNTTIRTEDDIKKSFKYPLIGTIPSWNVNEKSSYTKNGYRKNK